MPGVETFEDLVAWQRARELTKVIYEVTGEGAFARNFALVDQIRRAAVSAMSNVAEGFEREGPAEFRHFLSIAKASCGECRSLLYVALDAKYIDSETFDRLRNQVDGTSRVVVGLRKSVDRRIEQTSQSRRRPR